MAPGPTYETTSAPLADWFFITGGWNNSLLHQHPLLTLYAGVDSEQLTWSREEDLAINHIPPPSEPTIEEDRWAEADDVAQDFPPATPRNRKRNSYQRLSRLSDDARLSITSISSTPDKKGNESNRSSTTIKGIQIAGRGVLNDHDFDKALRKFASERDSFLSDLTLSAGAVVPNRPKPRPKTQRIVNEDASALKAGLGSIRRRVSFRDMSSIKRQSSVARQRKFSGPRVGFGTLSGPGWALLQLSTLFGS